MLCEKLGKNEKPSFFKLKNIEKNIYPALSCKNGKKRLIAVPNAHLQCIQSNLLSYLQYLDYPEYMNAGIKGKSYITNARMHKDNQYLFKLDISKFFPNTSRNKIYNFFVEKMNVSPDVATILTNLTTININAYKNRSNYNEISNFMKDNGIKQRYHLISGSPTSIIIAFLVNIEMFESLKKLCDDNSLTFTVYVDDLTFSSAKEIPLAIRNKIISIIQGFGYKISNSKTQYYTYKQPKKVTGVIIDKYGVLKSPNSLLKRAHSAVLEYKLKKQDSNILQIRGIVGAVNDIDGRFSSIRRILNRQKSNESKK